MKIPKNPGWFAGAQLVLTALLVILWGRFFLVEYFLPDRPLPGATDAGRYVKFTGGLTNRGRLAFIGQFGWQVEEAPSDRQKIRIPRKFDQVYANYNVIQQRCGMDLRRYRGKQVTRYTYKLCNHPSGRDSVQVNLLVYGNKVIAADVCDVALDGFLHAINERE